MKKIKAPTKKKSPKPRKKLIPALLCVDTFSKYCAVAFVQWHLCLDSLRAEDVYNGLHECFEQMGCFNGAEPIKERMPQTVYSDQAGGFIVEKLQAEFFAK